MSQDLRSDYDTFNCDMFKAEETMNKQFKANSSTTEIISTSISKISKYNNDKVKILQEKLAQSNARLYECKNACMILRQELNKAQKIIWNEIGENVTISSLSSNNNSIGWKGRSEQIQQLQLKVIELQNKLNNHEKSTSRSSLVCFEQKNISNLEKEKRQQIEKLSRELRQTEIVSENNRKKFEISKARIKVLENDLCCTKNNLMMISEKKLHDGQLIDALNGQVRAIENRYHDREIEIKNQRDKYQSNCVELKNELNAVKFQVEQLRKKIGERETEIEIMKSNKLERVTESYLSNIHIVKNSPINMIQNAEILNTNEYVSLSIAAEAECEKLFELVVVLNRRLDKERIDTDHISELYRCERNKNLKLEKKGQQLELERIKLSRISSGYRTKMSKSLSAVSSLKEQLNSEEMHYKLELLEEECLALKTRLMTVQQDKETDLTIYKNMLDNAKKIFQNTCRNVTAMARGHSAVTV